jgi:exopolysaccharide production protein ExoY
VTDAAMRVNSSHNGVVKVNGHSRHPVRQHAPARFSGEGLAQGDLLSRPSPLSEADLRDVRAPEPFVTVSNEDQPKLSPEVGQAGDFRIPRWKRLLDLGCILLAAPLWLTVMALVSSWILLASPGPLLYRQARIGYRGRRFMILKFRTMKINVETQIHEGYFQRLMQADCPMTKLDCHDARLIRGGRIIRALGLDELPQLFNVVRGEMSLVGPRPCTHVEFEHYQPAQKVRVNAPPGLTGYWQVNGKNKTTFSEMIAMDIFYGRHMSVRMDLTIIAKTVPAIATQAFESLTRKTGAKLGSILKGWRFGRRVR